eukprot:6181388-Pleurochrysis_carterae.AAC.5
MAALWVGCSRQPCSDWPANLRLAANLELRQQRKHESSEAFIDSSITSHCRTTLAHDALATIHQHHAPVGGTIKTLNINSTTTGV